MEEDYLRFPQNAYDGCLSAKLNNTAIPVAKNGQNYCEILSEARSMIVGNLPLTTKDHGFYLPSCFGHAMGDKGLSRMYIGGKTMMDAFIEWYNAPMDVDPRIGCSFNDPRCRPVCGDMHG